MTAKDPEEGREDPGPDLAPGDGGETGGDAGGEVRGDASAGGPEDLDVVAAADDELDYIDDDDDVVEGENEEGEGEGEGADEGESTATAKKKKKKDEDPDAELLYTKTKIPSVGELKKALAWAFEAEEVEPEVLERFAEHARLVLEGNKRMNLTAILDPKEVAAKHYLDSWRATRLLPLIGRTVLDLGTGAGFPGLPVAMAEPNCIVACLDSTKKRAEFVQECIDALGVKNASAVWERGEEHLLRNRYDIVLMRAISSVRENVRLLRKVRHSLKDLVLFKGPEWSREVRAGEREAERLGFRLDTVWEHELPDELGKRAVLVYRAPGGAGE